MRTLSDSLRALLLDSPIQAEALSDGIVNLSALARRLRPALEREHLKTFTDGAIVMALRRLAPALPSSRAPVHAAATVRTVTVRSGLVEYALENSRTLLKVQEKLLSLAEQDEDLYVHAGRGVAETAIIVSSPLEERLRGMLEGERVLKRFADLSIISIRFHPDTAHVPGVYYPFFRTLAWHGINFIEILSGFSELTFVFEDKEVDRAFATLKPLTRHPA